MPATIRVELIPSGRQLQAPRGTSLADLLFNEGVEFPCGGHGRCRGCRVRVLRGTLPITPDDQALISAKELQEGWRLACCARADSDLQLLLRQWEAQILGDNSRLAVHPRAGMGVAIDLGTTTLVAQLLDLSSGEVVAVRSALNQQAPHGADIMSRIEFALNGQSHGLLEQTIRRQLGALVWELWDESGRSRPLREVVLVGNTVMHHLFCGIPVEPLAQYPFQPVSDGCQTFRPEDLGWTLSDTKATMWDPACIIRFLPCLGGFVGSDILAGVLATGLGESEALSVLIDLGTNGEMVVGNRNRLLCASTAAGPAFEGARISMGMRAMTGAISEVRWMQNQFHCRTLGQGEPRGICGSGLVDAIAAALDAGLVADSGKLRGHSKLLLSGSVSVNQRDIRELQLAKGAICAGLRILLQQLGTTSAEVRRVFLAGAFGNYINQASARRIGLYDFSMDQIEAAGNTALRGAKMVLLGQAEAADVCQAVRDTVEHVSLDQDPRFQEIYLEAMGFPGAAGGA